MSRQCLSSSACFTSALRVNLSFFEGTSQAFETERSCINRWRRLVLLSKGLLFSRLHGNCIALGKRHAMNMCGMFGWYVTSIARNLSTLHGLKNTVRIISVAVFVLRQNGLPTTATNCNRKIVGSRVFCTQHVLRSLARDATSVTWDVLVRKVAYLLERKKPWITASRRAPTRRCAAASRQLGCAGTSEYLASGTQS